MPEVTRLENTRETGRQGVMQPDRGGTAQRGTDPAPRLGDLTRGVLRSAVRSARHVDAPDGELRKLLGRACRVARDHGIHAEQLIVMLKAGWRELPEACQMPRDDADAVLGRVITLCVGEYYAGRPVSD